MLALSFAVWVPGLCVLWLFAYFALRWLYSGQPAPRWMFRRFRSQADAYFVVANTGLLTAMFVTPGMPWTHWMKTAGLGHNAIAYFGPVVLLPGCLLILARVLDHRSRSSRSDGTA